MIIFSKSNKAIHNVSFAKLSGEEQIPCPKCSPDRKKAKAKCFSFNHDKGVGKCQHCGEAFYVRTETEFVKKEYVKPVWQNNTDLSDKVVQWFKGRGISQQTLIDLKITEGKEFMPASQKIQNTIQFNYFRDKELCNIKYRDGAKGFKMVKDAEMIFYNLDAIKETSTVIITEGEIDTLSFIEAGIPFVASVPNGATKNAKLEYLDNCYQYFENKEKIYLATDNDEAGRFLRDELARRLDIDKCFKVDFKDCKDANEYLVKYGVLELTETIKNAKQFPLDGVVEVNDIISEINDLYENGLSKGDVLGYEKLDELISFELGQMTTITGIPSHGKSQFLDNVMERLSVYNGWKFGVFSAENLPIKLHFSKIAEKIIGKSFGNFNNKMTPEEKYLSINFVQDHFKFISPKNEDFTTDNILGIAKNLILRYGIKGIVIDPYNALEHEIEKGQTETNYICNFLDKLGAFKRKFNIHIFLVAHPTKIPKDKATGKREVPDLYSISGSANFFNKTDNGITVYRDFTENNTQIHIQKIRFSHIGKVGMVLMNYNINNGRYCEAGTEWDNSNHLVAKPTENLTPNTNFDNENKNIYEPNNDSGIAPF